MAMKKRFNLLLKADLAKEQEIREFSKKLCIETHFNQSECDALLKLHKNLVREVPMDRMQFRLVLFNALEISQTFILDRIFRVVDLNGDGLVDGEEFVRCLSIMMRGTLEEMTEFCYDVYDVNGDRSLARDELFMCLEGSLRPGRGILEKDEIEEGIKDIVEIAMKKLDVNRDGQITFDDFRLAVISDPLLIQVCGKCLPPIRYSRAILFLVAQDYSKLSAIFNHDKSSKKGRTSRLSSVVEAVTEGAFPQTQSQAEATQEEEKL